MIKSIEGQVSTGLSNSNSTQSMLMQRRGSSIFSFGGGGGGPKPPMSRRDSTSSQSRYHIVMIPRTYLYRPQNTLFTWEQY